MVVEKHAETSEKREREGEGEGEGQREGREKTKQDTEEVRKEGGKATTTFRLNSGLRSIHA